MVQRRVRPATGRRQSMEAKGRKYFVRHLSVDDKRRQRGLAYQMQVLDNFGLATAIAYISETQDELHIHGEKVSIEVIRAVRSLAHGKGDFVDEQGQQLLPKNLHDRAGKVGRGMTILPPKVVLALQNLVHQLVIGDYESLREDGRIGRLTVEELSNAVSQYGRTLVDIPE